MQQTTSNRFTRVLFSTLFGLTAASFTISASAGSGKSDAFLHTAFAGDSNQLKQQLGKLPSCNSLSELLLSEGDSYYSLPPLKKYDSLKNTRSRKKTETTDEREFDQFLREIQGTWVGEAIESVCFQSGHARLHIYEVDDVDISHKGAGNRYTSGHHDVARISIDRIRVASSDKRASSGETRNVTVFKVPALADLHQIEKLGSDQFRISRLYRQRTTLSGNTVLREREDWISKSGNKLAWRTNWYTNGHYSGSDLNVLKRRR